MNFQVWKGGRWHLGFTLAGEPQLAVVLLVVDHVDEVGEHLAAVTTDEYVGTACNKEKGRISVKSHEMWFHCRSSFSRSATPSPFQKQFYSLASSTLHMNSSAEFGDGNN